MTETEPKSTTEHLHTKTGVVSSISGDKTIRVTVATLVRHARYGKYLRRRTNYAVHDPKNEASPDDVVEIAPCRPISKRKSWRLIRVVRSQDIPAELATQ